MTFTVTPQPGNVPPRVQLELDTGVPATPYIEITIKRDGVPIREQPFAGSDVALAYDYEAPFGVPVEYVATGFKASFANQYATAWPNLTGWTTDHGSPGVTGGRFYSTIAGSSRVSRSLALLAAGQLILGPGLVGNSTAVVTLPTASGHSITVSRQSGNLASVSYGGTSVSFDIGSGDIVCTFDASGLSVDTTTDSKSVVRGVTTDPVTTLRVTAYDGAARVSAVTVKEPSGAPVAFSESATTELDVDEAWLIHPSQPSLSCSIDPGAGRWREDGINVAPGTKQNLSRRQVATVFNPVGRSRAVVVTHGNRLEGDWTLDLLTPRLEDRDTVQAIITDQTPLLFRAPVDWEWDLPDGWYSVGDVDEARSFPSAGLAQPYRNIILPLTPVDAPIVRQGALWTWAGVVITYETWEDVRDANATWLDLLAGPVA